MATVQRNRQKDWVRRLLIPYAVFFAVSCLVSVVSMVVKLQIIRQKFLSRHEAAALMVAAEPTSLTSRPRHLPEMQPSTALSKAAAVQSKAAILQAQVCGRRCSFWPVWW